MLHAEDTALSRRRIQREVANSRHNIQHDQPQAIVEAINDVLDQRSVKVPSL